LFYRIGWDCDEKDDLQAILDDLCGYGKDLDTKICHRKRLNLVYSLMDRFIKDGTIELYDSAIDIGCGSGVYSKMISDFGFKHVLGVDIIEDLEENTKKRYSDEIAQGKLSFKSMNAEKLDASLKFDFILCTEVIEHVDNPQALIAKIKGILSEKGVAIISMPNVLSAPYFLRLVVKKLRRKEIDHELRTHLSYPFFKTIAFFRERGFRIRITTGTNLLLSNPILKWIYGKPIFGAVNKTDSAFSASWPLKYFSQFFFIVIKKEPTYHQ